MRRDSCKVLSLRQRACFVNNRNTGKGLRVGSAPNPANEVLRQPHGVPTRERASLLPDNIGASQAAIQVETRATRKGLLQSNLFVFLLLCSVAFVLYLPTLNSGLQLDDLWWFDYVKRGALGLNHTNLGFWRPVISITFWCLWKCFGLFLPAYRMFNMLLAATAAYGLRSIWLRMFSGLKNAAWLGTAVGVVFLVWPSHPETTAWIAGMTDGISITFGILAIWSYISYCQDSKLRYLILAVCLLATAMLAKEAAFTFPLICLLVGGMATPWKRSETLKTAMNSVLMLGLMALYMVARSHVIGKVVGGYTNSTREFYREFFRGGFAINLSHAYLPFDRFLANWQGPETVNRVLCTGLVLAGILVVRLRPRTKPISEKMKVFLTGLLVFWLVLWLYFLALGQYQGTYFVVLEVLDEIGPGGRVASALLVATLLVLAASKGRARRAAAWFAARAKAMHAWFDPEVRPLAMPIAFTILTYLIHRDAWVSTPENIILVFVCLWAAFASRPVTQTGEEADQMRARTIASNAAIIAFAASVLALLPACISGLPVSFIGEFRLSYAATAFSALALIAFLCCVFRSFRAQAAAVGCCCAVALAQFVPCIMDWRQSGIVAKKTEQVIKGMLPARRIYVLASPGNIDGAGLYVIDMQLLASDLYGDEKVKILQLFRELAVRRDDRIDGHKVGADDYELTIRPSNPKRLYPLTTIYDSLAYGFYSSTPDILPDVAYNPKVQKLCFPSGAGEDHLAHGGIIHLKGFHPSTDRVLVVDGNGARRLDL